MSLRSLHEKNNSILSFHQAEDFSEDLAKDDVASISEENFIKYENTYRMESKNPFNVDKVAELVKNEIEKHFKANTKYDPLEAANVCATMSSIIRDNVCHMDFDRFKIICIVQIVQKKNQGFVSGVQFLRDVNRDKYVKDSFENNYLCVSVMVGSLYYE